MEKRHRYVVCIKNRGYAVALELRKIYRVITDSSASVNGLVRVVDESGEDYLYPDEYFAPIEVPASIAKSFSKRTD